MRVLSPTYGSRGSRGDVESMVGPGVRLRALQARGAEMPMRAPSDFAERLAHVGVSLALAAPIGQPAPGVTGATPPPQLAGEGRDALVTTSELPAMPVGACQ